MGTTGTIEAAPLSGRRIGITADRKSAEQADLFLRRGAEVMHGPTMVTVDLSAEEPLRLATVALVDEPPDHLVVTTGMGLRLWLEATAGWGLGDGLAAALSSSAIIARGAKAASAVRRAGFEVAWRAPEETMEEVVDHLARAVSGAPRPPRVALQLFDPADHPSTEALRALARELVEVPVYRWRLPGDVGPARALIEATIEGRLDAVTFTSQPAVRHLVRIAGDAGRAEALIDALNGGVLAACIGPVCAAAAREVGIEEPVWPEPPRLPAMARQITEHLQPLANGES
ncbi:MAG: uroporphyrinogen-III synthase [Actinomycetota bacterium]|jgi:uroporphyrinogen-III synthase|nr:uroporphyrinogen-III synthase [Actinomycetota bacterium]